MDHNATIRAARKLGMRESKNKVSFHSSRHFYATTLAVAGFDEAIVAVALGHKKKGVTQIYIHHCRKKLADGIDAAFDSCKVTANTGREATEGL